MTKPTLPPVVLAEQIQPGTFVLLAEALAIVIGPLAGVLPARSAALLGPVQALRSE